MVQFILLWNQIKPGPNANHRKNNNQGIINFSQEYICIFVFEYQSIIRELKEKTLNYKKIQVFHS
jgi:hypothetical protein